MIDNEDVTMVFVNDPVEDDEPEEQPTDPVRRPVASSIKSKTMVSMLIKYSFMDFRCIKVDVHRWREVEIELWQIL
jgi:hypothetical protein